MNDKETISLKKKPVSKMVKIQIANVPGAKKSRSGNRVFVGAQGKGYLIERGKPVLVPQIVVNVLRDAVQTEYEYDEESGENIPFETPSYPFSVLSE